MTNTLVQISIITAIYNKSQYLDDYVESIKSQSFKNFEVICVEDCSTDDSMEHLQELVLDDSRFVIVQNEVNSGLSVSRNKAIKMSKGKYICFLDADDCFRPNALEILWKSAEKFKLEGIFFGASEYSEDLKRELRTIQYKKQYPVCDGKSLMALLHERNEYQSACGFQLWNKEFIRQMEVDFFPGIVYEDTLFTLQTLLRAKRVMVISDVLYIYRKCNNSISHSLGIEQLYSCVVIYDELSKIANEYLDDYQAYPEILDRIQLFSRRIEHIVCTVQEDSLPKFYNSRYNMILQTFLKDYKYPYLRTLSIDEINKLKRSKQVFIFGDGVIAEETLVFLKRQDVKIKGIIVSYLEQQKRWHDYRMIAVDDFYEDGIVVISVTEKWRDAIESILHMRGNETIYITQNG
ncbi:MAG: glycosyltransferase [Lachnospiraceae bacterium]|nr:glycosyltransferase [Lachnospiraceae bacterium]